MESLLQSIEANCAEFWLLGESAQTLLFRLTAINQTKASSVHVDFLALETQSLLADIGGKINTFKRNMGWSAFRIGCRAWWEASTWRDMLEANVAALELHHKHLYLGIANRTARDFWLRYADHGTLPCIPWPRFRQAYDGEDMQDIKAFLLSSGGGAMVHISDFSALAQVAGFPYDLEVVSIALRKRFEVRSTQIVSFEHSVNVVEERLYLAKQLAELERENMVMLDNALDAVISYSRDMHREHGADWYSIWATRLLPRPVGSVEHDDVDDINLAHDINQYYRACLLIMHRYMKLWRLPIESFGIFHCVDFPPQHQVLQVVEYLQPLDDINEHMGLQRAADPALFAFLRALLPRHEDAPVSARWRPQEKLV